MRKFFISFIALTLSSISAYADTLPTHGFISCPNISQINKNKQSMLWGTANGNWRSFAVSFANHVDQFLGAQWEGVNLGNLFCIYRGEKLTFTINLQYHGLIHVPTNGKWSKNMGGYKNCISHKIKDCRFKPYITQHKSYNTLELNALHGQHVQQMGF